MGWNGILVRVNLKEFLSDETLEDYRKRIDYFKKEFKFPKQDLDEYVKLVRKIKEQKAINSQFDWERLVSSRRHWESYKKAIGGWSFMTDFCCMSISRRLTTQSYFHLTVPFLLEKVSEDASKIWQKLCSRKGREPRKFFIDGHYYRLDIGKDPASQCYSFIVEDEIRILQDALFVVLENKPKFKEYIEEYVSKDECTEEWSVGFLEEFTKEMHLELIYLMLRFSKDGDIMIFGNV